VRCHAIGDSNSIYNFTGLPLFEIHHLGSVRMRDIADGTTPLNLPTTLGVEAGDVCFFCAGEIDVRCDWSNVAAATGDSAGMMAVLVRRYVDVLRKAMPLGVQGWIVSVLPSAYAVPLPAWVRDHPVYPYVGPDQERARYTLEMNRLLWERGADAGFRLLDLHHRYADAAGMMRPELSSYMHVADNRPVFAELCEQGLYPAGAAMPEGEGDLKKHLDRVAALFAK
jgi:hypothetical protein